MRQTTAIGFLWRRVCPNLNQTIGMANVILQRSCNVNEDWFDVEPVWNNSRQRGNHFINQLEF